MRGHPHLNDVVDGQIICVRCEEWQDPSEFPSAPKMSRGRHSWCRRCQTGAQRDKHASMSDSERKALRARRRRYGAEAQRRARRERPDVGRSATLKYRYGITLADFERMEEEQGGLCAVCGEPPGGMGRGGDRLHVDHDHQCCPGRKACGECVRGLVCWPCNLVMGLVQDDPGRLEQIARYLKDSME